LEIRFGLAQTGKDKAWVDLRVPPGRARAGGKIQG
jgi:hypothetical protein